MAKKKSAATKKPCDCLDEVDKQLAEFNTRVVRHLSMDLTTRKASMVFTIPTEKIDSSKRGKAKTLMARCCPVCGNPFPN